MNPAKTASSQRGLVWLLGIAAGCLIANLYYAQPLVRGIAADLKLEDELAGGIVSMTQLGYGCGMLLVVPLSDLVENRRLVLYALSGVVASLFLTVAAPSTAVFAVAALILGLTCSVAQVVIPFVAHLVEGPGQARAIATTMAIVLTAVTLSRPIALLIADAAGWRAVFLFSALSVSVLGLMLARQLPRRNPASTTGYLGNLRSLALVMRTERRVRTRAFYQAAMFAAFNLYWVAVPMVLSTEFSLSKSDIAIFSLVGAAGAFAAPLAARLASRGHMRWAMVTACTVFAAALGVSNFALALGFLFAFGVLAILIDASFHIGQTFGRLVALDVDPSVRGRANSLYMTILFAGGAFGSLAGGFSYDSQGWLGVTFMGMCLSLAVAIASLYNREIEPAK